jgi:diadenosine tetraphosphate (Ap4A) HIT family hydrolase
MDSPQRPTAYHQRLPYGERVSPDPLLGGPFFAFDGDVQVVPLAEPVLPEPPRAGESGGQPCPTCTDPDSSAIWRDDRWVLKAGLEPSGLPMVALLLPRDHYRLDNLSPELLAGLGPMIQRVAGAVRRIDGVGRTHFSRFGDGSEHFHVWFFARPVGMMQLRGPLLSVWGDILPPVPDDEFRANARTVATVLAEVSGQPLGVAAD